MNRIYQILLERDGLQPAEALELMQEARMRVFENGEDPEEILYEDFGLEPDYVIDLLGG